VSTKPGIEWTDHTFNPWWGCTKVSPACDYCYAETLAKRYGFKVWGKDAERRFFGDHHWHDPFRWNHAAGRDGVRRGAVPLQAGGDLRLAFSAEKNGFLALLIHALLLNAEDHVLALLQNHSRLHFAQDCARSEGRRTRGIAFSCNREPGILPFVTFAGPYPACRRSLRHRVSVRLLEKNIHLQKCFTHHSRE
jgi:hypothetical protein